MYPEVRAYADPFEGLTVQLTELRGLIKIVPPLIDADRERRWTEIGERPSDGEDGEVIDVYGAEAGPEEGYGFADFGRTIRANARLPIKRYSFARPADTWTREIAGVKASRIGCCDP